MQCSAFPMLSDPDMLTGHLALRCRAAAVRSWRCRCVSSGRCWWCYRPLPSPAAAASRPPSASCRRRGASPASSGIKPFSHLIALIILHCLFLWRRGIHPQLFPPQTLSSKMLKKINRLHRSVFQISSGDSLKRQTLHASFKHRSVREASFKRIKIEKMLKIAGRFVLGAAAAAAAHLLIPPPVWRHQEEVRGWRATWGRRHRRGWGNGERRGEDRKWERQSKGWIFVSSTQQETTNMLNENQDLCQTEQSENNPLF